MEARFSTVIVALPALGYASGYSYLDAYYKFFGVRFSELEIGIEDVVVHSAPAALSIIQNFWISVPLLIVAFVLIDKNLLAILSPLKHVGYLALVVLMFISLRASGEAGTARAEQDLHNLPLLIDNYQNEMLAQLTGGGASSNLHMLAQTSEHTVAVISYFGSISHWTVRIPNGDGPWHFTFHEQLSED